MAENPPRKTALASLVVSLVAGVLFFSPGFLGIDGFDGGFAISFVSLLAAVIGIIVALYYFSLASKLDGILRGEGVLARWTYSPEFWREYTEKEYAEEKTEKKGLFIMVSVIALIVGFVFVLVDSEAGLFVFAVMLGLIGLVAFVWQFSSWYDHRQNVHGVREAIIARNAVYINKKFHRLAHGPHQLRRGHPKKQPIHAHARVHLHSYERSIWTPILHDKGAHPARRRRNSQRNR